MDAYYILDTYYSGGRAQTLITNLIGLEGHSSSAIQSGKTLSVMKRVKTSIIGLEVRVLLGKIDLQLINQRDVN